MMKLLATVCLASLALVQPAAAQTSVYAGPPTIKRTPLQRADLGDREMIMGIAEIPPGGSAGRHYHHGTESGYVLEGTLNLAVDGEAPRIMKAGESYLIPNGKVHDAITVGDSAAKVIAVYIVEKGKPLAEPVPAKP